MKAIGIDVGTTSLCAVLLDLDNGAVIRSETVNYGGFLSTTNKWERLQDAVLIEDKVRTVLDDFITDGVCAIGFTGQMHGIVYVDGKGRLVSNLYNWQDGRGNLPYKNTTYAQFLGSRSGYGNVTDFYNRTNGVRPKGATCYCTISDYLAMSVCGRRTPLMHVSNAGGLGLFNLTKGCFDIDLDVELTSGYSVVGEYKGIPVGVAIGDNQASVFSTLADERDLLVNVGTGSQVSVVMDRAIQSPDVEARPYFDGKYLAVGSALCGGRAYSALKDFFKDAISNFAKVSDGDVYEMMERSLEEARGDGVIVDTRFAGTRREPFVRGSIKNLSVENFTPAFFAEGVLQGISNELFELYGQMGVESLGIVASGNAVRKNLRLIDILESRFDKKIKIPLHNEEAAVGAALFASIAAGAKRNACDAQELIRYK